MVHIGSKMPRSILFVAPLLAAGGVHAFTSPPRRWAAYVPSRSRGCLAAAIDRDSDADVGEIRSESRRGTIFAGLGGALSSLLGGRADAAPQTAGALLADFPMRR